MDQRHVVERHVCERGARIENARHVDYDDDAVEFCSPVMGMETDVVVDVETDGDVPSGLCRGRGRFLY